MTEQWSVPAWALVATPVVGVLLVALVLVALARSRRAVHELRAVHEGAEVLQLRLDALEQSLARSSRSTSGDQREYVITHVGERSQEERADEAADAPAVPAPLFADLVLREGAVQAASLAHGLRRALAPETRHRIRFEMRREVKRARRQRRADLRAARRAWQARGRAEQAVADGAGPGQAEPAA